MAPEPLKFSIIIQQVIGHVIKNLNYSKYPIDQRNFMENISNFAVFVVHAGVLAL